VVVSRFLLALAVSAAVVLSAPFNREMREWVRSTFPGHFVLVVASVVAVAIALAIIAALVRIRDRRAMRYSAIVAALVLGAGYSAWNAQGRPEVDAVEQFHFVEYGLITFLFYRAWRPIGDASLFLLPIAAGFVVGTIEEWVQWFIPGRIGDMRDVFLNGAAIVCGLLFSIGVDPPARLSRSLQRGSLRRIGVFWSLATLTFAAFVYSVHVGVENLDAETGSFRSRYHSSTLVALSQDRAIRWKASPPIARPRGLGREDQYQNEGHLHVTERNRLWELGDMRGAWYENLILEKYYAPVLDSPSFLAKQGHRWPDEQRRDAQQRFEAARAANSTPYESLADVAEGRHFIRLWRPTVFWTVALLAVVAILAVTFSIDNRRIARVPSAESRL
jgi:hypothetical protein